MLHEEPFGPVLTVASFSTIEEAIEKANATECGLASYFFSDLLEVQKQMLCSLSAGAISINHLKGALPMHQTLASKRVVTVTKVVLKD